MSVLLPQEAFKHLLPGAIAPALKAHGFSKSNQTFYLRHEKNWELVNFQKSVGSTASMVIFTVNVGVTSGILSNFHSGRHPSGRPNIWACAWQRRLGSMLPDHQEKWWSISTDETDQSLEQLAQALCSEIGQVAVPAIKNYIHDEGLRDLWLSGPVPWITDFARVRSLSVLLKAIGPRNLLPTLLDELQRLSEGNAALTRLAEDHIRKLEGWEPE